VEAAPLMCAGVTIYAAIKKTGLNPRQRIGIIGCGGGLGHLGLQFATAMGLRVYGVENADKPLALARGLKNIYGATIIDSRSTTAEEAIAHISKEDRRPIPGQFGLDAVIILPESQKAFQYGVDMLKNHGKCVVVSFPPDGFHMTSLDLIFRDITFVGNVSGSTKQLREMAAFSAKHGIKAQIDTFPLEQLNKLVEAYLSGHGGKLVVDYHYKSSAS
jgi:D-arabinose 1-dehydrogenase-like Zn-dependent alcohol dehydrogenase